MGVERACWQDGDGGFCNRCDLQDMLCFFAIAQEFVL
jgi:hypothetical protein